jgi:hypothetical protein|nr:FixH family protein [Kofleriaceae bacterium]
MARLGALALATLGLGCSSPAADLDTAPLVEVDSVTSQSGAVQIDMLAHGATPVRGLHTMQLIFTNVSDGAPVEALELEIVPWMPAMGHGTSLLPQVEELGSGVYEIDDLDLYMAGQWQLRTGFGSSDNAEPALQIE